MIQKCTFRAVFSFVGVAGLPAVILGGVGPKRKILPSVQFFLFITSACKQACSLVQKRKTRFRGIFLLSG